MLEIISLKEDYSPKNIFGGILRKYYDLVQTFCNNDTTFNYKKALIKSSRESISIPSKNFRKLSFESHKSL